MARKIMVFDERINSYDESVLTHEPRDGICDYCYKWKVIKFSVINHAFLHPLDMCDDCATKYHGGCEVRNHEGIIIEIPTDPLLDYLNEIDPIDEITATKDKECE